jgi:uncharacterized protein (DUF305 family)
MSGSGFLRTQLIAAVALVSLAACASATRSGGNQAVQTIMTNAPLNQGDVKFMTGMIPHHAQAVKIAGWAATHSAGAEVKRLCERIVVGQRDEIELMRNWLLDRKLPAPPADATHARMEMNGMRHDMLMSGMLNDSELAQLDAARGSEFDRLFLTFMIRHHEGAVSMVDELFGTQGAGQDEDVFRLASDIYADQTTEIDRMEKMLAGVPAVRVP